MSDEYQEYAEPINEEEEDGNTTTVQFIAVSADEHERMIREGELPATIQVHTYMSSHVYLCMTHSSIYSRNHTF